MSSDFCVRASHHLYLIELRDAKLLCGAAGEDGELVQGEFLFENEDGVVAFSSFI